MIIWFLFFSLFMWYITLIDLRMLKNSCIPGLNSIWSCVIHLMRAYALYYQDLHFLPALWEWCVLCAKSLQSYPTFCDPTDHSPPGSSTRGMPRQEYWSGLPCPPVLISLITSEDDHLFMFSSFSPLWLSFLVYFQECFSLSILFLYFSSTILD